jgi:hypothetical protein
MAKDRPKGAKRDQDHPAAARTPGERGTAGVSGTASASGPSGGQHHAAKAHGRPAKVDESLPATRAELLALHAAARRKRSEAPLGSDAFRAAVDEIGRIEIRIAAVDRAADPPLG